MRNLILFAAVAALLSPFPAAAQQTEKRSDIELMPVSAAKEPVVTDWGLYDFENTLEVGGQFVDRHGNRAVYRSQVNYTGGVRLSSFSLRGKARDQGAFFTRMYVEGAGWGGDPYNWFRYGLSKDRWFDFRADYLRSDYYFTYPGFARNERTNDQERRRQSYELTLFPQRKLRLRLAYRRNSAYGLALTSNDIESTRDLFTHFLDVRSTFDEYTLGADWNIQRWSFFFDYSYRFQRVDNFYDLVTPPVPNVGNVISGASAGIMNAIERFFPGRGRIPSVRFTVSGRPHHTLDVSARIVYSRAKFEYTRFEINDGRSFDPAGAPPPVSFVRFWSSDNDPGTIRPNTLADFSVSWRPVPKVTISNTFRFNGFDIAGGDLTNIVTVAPASPALTGVLAPPAGAENLTNLFDVDYFVNRFELRYDFASWLGVRAGHRHLHRDAFLQHTEVDCVGALLPSCTGGTLSFDTETEPATRVANVATLGGDLRLHKTFKLFVDWERGGIDSVFNRIRRGHRTTARVRARWEPWAGVRFNASWVQFDLRAPSPDVDSNQRNRGFSVDFALFKWERFYWDIGYSRNDVSSFTQIGRRISATVFRLVDGPTGIDCLDTLVPGQWTVPGYNIPCRPSTYIDNNNYAYFDLGGRLVRKLHAEIGYRVFTATGTYAPSDPEGDCPRLFFGPCNVYASAPGITVIRSEWGGFNYHQPHATLWYDFTDRFTLKGGWRWYGYNVKIGTLTDYKAHLATVSAIYRW